MRVCAKELLISAIVLCFHTKSFSQVHPKETLARKVFDSLRYNDFKMFHEQSIFSLDETEFKSFLYRIRNQSLRQELISLHRQPFPESAITVQSKWEIAFKHNWRQQWRHLSRYSPDKVREDSFLPILRTADEFGIQWKTVKLLAIEVLVPVTWEDGRFQFKSDLDLDENSSNAKTMHLDRGLTYRFKLDEKTYSKALMIGHASEDSEKKYDSGILGNGKGESDLLVRLGQESPDRLFYFCPDQKGGGGVIEIKNYDEYFKPNQRTDLLLTFSFGNPLKAYQILLKEVLSTQQGPKFCEKPTWLGEITQIYGLNFN